MWKHLVAQYTLLDFNQIGELNYVTFLEYRRDAFIQRYRETPEGREYLDNAWRMEQTDPDRAGLRKKLGKGEPSNGS
jgi:hypothetical protein